MNNQLAFSLQSGHILLYIVLTIVALGVSFWSYRYITGQVSRLKKYLLISLRTAGIILIGLMLLEPLLTIFNHKTTGNKLGVVVDLSSSMAIKDGVAQRWQKAESTFARQMVGSLPTEYFGFSDTLISLDRLPDSAAFSGQATDLSLALSLPFDKTAEDIGALLFITDGAGNIGKDPLESASMVDLPVYSLVVGSAISRKDVFISKINYPPIGYTNTETSIDIEFGASGYAGKFAQIELRDDKKTITTKRVSLPGDGALSTETFKLIETEPGVKYLKAAISSFDDENYKANNSRNFVVKFLKDKIQVLVLSLTLNWETTFLKRTLEADQHLKILTAIGDRQGMIDSRDLPVGSSAWANIDLVVAIDLHSKALGAQINDLKAAVKSKTGFLYIAGASSRPLQINSWNELMPISTTSSTDLKQGEFFPSPTENHRAKAILDIEGMRWEQLPPLQFVVTPTAAKAESWVMMDMPTATKERWPAIIAGNYERGKTAAMLGYPWWPRTFKSAANTVDSKHIEQFWGNLVRWLVTRDDLEKFNIATDKPVYKLGEPVTFSASLFDANYNLISGGKIKVTIADSSAIQRELLLLGDQPGKYVGDFGSPAPSKYSYSAVAISGNDTLGQRQGSFMIESASLEMENPSANYQLMQKIAEQTGGKSYTVDNFSQFAQNLKLKIEKSETANEYRPIGNLYILILVILLFSCEWAIRKFSQLP